MVQVFINMWVATCLAALFLRFTKAGELYNFFLLLLTFINFHYFFVKNYVGRFFLASELIEFLPSENILENETAQYECFGADSTIHVQWFFEGKPINKGVVERGVVVHSTNNLTVFGMAINNGSVIKCQGVSPDFTKEYKESILLIQGI